MKTSDIIRMRLSNQFLAGKKFKSPVDAVSWLGAVQSQDYTGAKWALGLRSQMTDLEIDELFNQGKILRTHVMRPTWHFVAPEDIRWLLKLTAPRVLQLSAYYFRKAELDQEVFKLTHTLLEKTLRGGNALTRDEIKIVLERGGVKTIAKDNLLRIGYILMEAELTGLICSGGKRGKQFTYALLDERAPLTKEISREEALAALTVRYFRSHGPASIKDFVWWSGLTVKDVREGIELVKNKMIREFVDGKEYWFTNEVSDFDESSEKALLLSNYDEYTIGYTEHDEIFNPRFHQKFELRYPHSIVIDGVIVGGWKRELKKNSVVIIPQYFRSIDVSEKRCIEKAAEKYSEFLGTPVVFG